MHIGTYAFRPRLLPTLAALLVLAALVALGFWQLDRAQQKRQIEAAYRARQARPPVPLEEALAMTGERRYLPVEISGRYDPVHQFLLDNQTSRGRVGYRVLTPFRSGKRILLVDRGWVPMGMDRQTLPPIPVDGGSRRIKGMLAPPPSPGLILGPPLYGKPTWPQVIERVDPKAIAERLGAAPLSNLVLLDPAEAEGYVREWKPPGLGVQRHIGYAIQWFVMAAVLVLIYLKVNLVPLRRAGIADEAGSGG